MLARYASFKLARALIDRQFVIVPLVVRMITRDGELDLLQLDRTDFLVNQVES
jgi:hypothetical protein